MDNFRVNLKTEETRGRLNGTKNKSIKDTITLQQLSHEAQRVFLPLFSFIQFLLLSVYTIQLVVCKYRNEKGGKNKDRQPDATLYEV